MYQISFIYRQLKAFGVPLSNALFDLIVIYFGLFYLDGLCEKYWYIFTWFDLFPFLKNVKCQTALVPFVVSSMIFHLQLYLVKLFVKEGLIFQASVAAMEVFRIFTFGIIIANPYTILPLQSILNWIAYGTVFIFVVTLNDLAWIPGELIQKLVIKYPHNETIIHTLGTILLIIQAIIFIYEQLYSSSRFITVLLYILIALQVYYSRRGSIITILMIAIYLQYLWSLFSFPDLNFAILCFCTLIIMFKYENNLMIALIIAGSQSLIYINTFMKLLISLQLFLIYLRSLWVVEQNKID